MPGLLRVELTKPLTEREQILVYLRDLKLQYAASRELHAVLSLAFKTIKAGLRSSDVYRCSERGCYASTDRGQKIYLLRDPEGGDPRRLCQKHLQEEVSRAFSPDKGEA